MKFLGTIVDGHVRLDTPSPLPDGLRVSVIPAQADFAPPPTETYEQHLAILRESITRAEAGEQGRSVDDVFAEIERQLGLSLTGGK